jgi:transcriptional regulator with GAF, ATPase, and Fis domain
VLIQDESGMGKELVAKAIHYTGAGSSKQSGLWIALLQMIY